MNAKIWCDEDDKGSYFCVNDDRWLTFDKDKHLRKMYLPGVSYIPRGVFYAGAENPGTFETFEANFEAGVYAKTLEYVEELDLPDVIRIEGNNFGWMEIIKTLKIPKCEFLGERCFWNVTSLTDIDAKSLVWCENSVFQNICFNFENPVILDFPNLTITQRYFCQNAFAVREVNMPNVKVLGMGAFGFCRYLKEFNGPELMVMEDYVFQECDRMTSVRTKKLRTVGSHVLEKAYNLKEFDAENLGAAGVGCHQLVYDRLLQNKTK